MYATNDLAATDGKIVCVKTLGDLVRSWRLASGLSYAEMARLVGDGVKYQNLQQLEAGGAKHPRYLAALARAMGATVDDLLALRMPPPLGSARGPTPNPAAPRTGSEPPKPDFKATEFTHSDWATWQDVKLVLPEEELERIRREAERVRRIAAQQLSATATTAGADHERRVAPAPVEQERRAHQHSYIGTSTPPSSDMRERLMNPPKQGRRSA